MSERNFRIRIVSGDFEVELEGESQTVIQQFEKLKKEGLGSLPHSADILSHLQPGEGLPADGTKSVKTSIRSDLTFPEEPHENLNNVLMKGLVGPEVEWLLIYAFYSSNFGQGKFNREEILSRYEETGRITTSRKSNLSNNIKTAIRKDWVMAINPAEFVITEEGIKRAKMILTRNRPRNSIKKQRDNDG